MSENYNLSVLLEESEKISLGIRSRQAGITLKEYFLTQRERCKRILKAQKEKLKEALEMAYNKALSNRNAKSSQVISFVNKAGKVEKRIISNEGTTASKVYINLKKIVHEIYSLIRYRCSEISKKCAEGISRTRRIIKGDASAEYLSETREIKEMVVKMTALLSETLSCMRAAFKAFHSSGI